MTSTQDVKPNGASSNHSQSVRNDHQHTNPMSFGDGHTPYGAGSKYEQSSDSGPNSLHTS